MEPGVDQDNFGIFRDFKNKIFFYRFVSPSNVHCCGPSKKELDDALTVASTLEGEEW